MNVNREVAKYAKCTCGGALVFNHIGHTFFPDPPRYVYVCERCGKRYWTLDKLETVQEATNER